MGVGLGYTWFWGDFIFNENDKITVDPKVFLDWQSQPDYQMVLIWKRVGFMQPDLLV